MAKTGEVVLSATERMLVEKQKMEIKRMRMTKEQLELFRDTFVIFDKDGDGTIDSKELSTVLKSMGYNPNKEEIQEMVDEVRTTKKFNVTEIFIPLDIHLFIGDRLTVIKGVFSAKTVFFVVKLQPKSQ